MGKYDSSKTRVAPVFNCLRAKDPTGRSWLPKLLDLPNRRNEISLPSNCDFTIQRACWEPNEIKLDPPVALLSWLIRNPTRPKSGELSADPVKQTKRRELISGCENRLVEALALLRHNPHNEDWHIVEGQTRPDVFIVTRDVSIVIEGKRTEREATTCTTWMAGRHQMLRHIDCAWEIRAKKQVIGFFIVEGDGNEGDIPPHWLDYSRKTTSAAAMGASLPHRGPEEQGGIASCFIGVTTWQTVCREFGINWAGLPMCAAD
jgi:hypothetical protein